MIKTFCDRCKDEIVPDGTGAVNITVETPCNLYTIGRAFEVKYQLCSKCAEALEQFIKGEEAET